MKDRERRTHPAILTDEEIRQMGYFTPFSFLHGVQEFKSIVETACSSAADCSTSVESAPAQVILAMRNVYFMGVQHGAERYRWTLARDRDIHRSPAEEPPQPMNYEMPPGTMGFARYLSAADAVGTIAQLLGIKGVTKV